MPPDLLPLLVCVAALLTLLLAPLLAAVAVAVLCSFRDAPWLPASSTPERLPTRLTSG